VGLVVVLRHRLRGRTVVVATTHLSCNFQEPCTQIAQAQLVVTCAARVAERHGPGTAIVIGADLNSIPGSGVYHLLQHGSLPQSHPHLQIAADGVTMPRLEGGGDGGDGLLTLPVQLQSAYTSVLGARTPAERDRADGRASNVCESKLKARTAQGLAAAGRAHAPAVLAPTLRACAPLPRLLSALPPALPAAARPGAAVHQLHRAPDQLCRHA
jgi:hypothetical protein